MNRGALALFLSATTSAAFAADPAAPAQPAPASGWQVTVGLGPQLQTAFPGARAVTVWPTGTLDLRRPGEPIPFSSPDDGFGLSLLDYGWIKAGPVARIVPSRGLSNGNGAFYGLPNVNWTLELGIYGELWYTEHFRARGEVRQGVNGHDGLDANIALDAIQRFGAFTFAVGPRLQLGDTQYMNAYFSVTPYQAFLNGRVTPFQASGGLASVGVLGSVKYDFTPSWSATLFGGYNRLVSNAAASPIPHNLGSLNEYTAGVVVAHSFNLNLPFLP
jgi:outer membrane scaffolding protein for murein synthesis (MipA/OmpV family)